MKRLLARAREAASLLRLRPFDSSTPGGRSRERYRRVALTVLVSAGARATGLVSILITVPLTVHYLGEERYGLWMTITSFLSLLAFADLGMGNGLLNAIAEAHGRDDPEAARTHVSSGLLMLCATGAVLVAGLAVSYPLVPWDGVFNVRAPQAAREAGPAFVALVACFAVAMPLGVAARIQSGVQEGFVSDLWTAAGSLLSLAAIVAAVAAGAGLPWLVLCAVGVPAVASLGNTLFLFGIRHPSLRPAWSRVSRASAVGLLRTGSLFVLLQLAAALAFATDNVVAAHVLGPESVTEYSVSGKLFTIAPMLVAFVLAPLWPAYSEAIARGDLPWVRRTLVRSLVLAVGLTGAASGILVLFGTPILRLWVGDSVRPDPVLLLGFGVWTILSSAGASVAVFLNGAGEIRAQVICAGVMAAAALGAKIGLARVAGLPGIVWGTVAAYAAFTALPMCFYVPRVFGVLARRAPAVPRHSAGPSAG
ncbi:MAG: lipopolysaccharide biosynthesis protein [Planctomycetales bacterium]|nr:lipopolysaccharide biosynthesis protein [Planctomycetales bacterium]